MSTSSSATISLGIVAVLFLSGCMTGGSLDGGDSDAHGDHDEHDDHTADSNHDQDTASPSDNGTPSPTVNNSIPTGSATNETTADNNTTSGNFTAYEWGPQAQATVRPGVQVLVGDSVCTTNFLYRSPLNGTYYLGIAAHCVYDTVGEEVFLSNAIGVLGSQGVRIGRVAYSSYHELGVVQTTSPQHTESNDLALIRIDEGMLAKTHPSMKHFGGPVGNVTSLSDVSIGEKVLAHGDTPMRPGPDEIDRLEGYVTGTTTPWTVHAYFAPYSFQGDSGSAVITGDGKALGVLVSLAAFPPGETGISFLPPMLAFAADKGFAVEVVTWEQFDSGMLPG